MSSFTRDPFQVLLSALLVIALASTGWAKRTPDLGSNGKRVRFDQECQLAFSAQTFETKSETRKPATPWIPQVVGAAGQTIDFDPGVCSFRLSTRETAWTMLLGLNGIRGRAPPVEFLP